MLLADKRDLQNHLKRSILHIEEKELAYYTQNCYAMGTRSAVLILFSLSGFTQVDSTMLDDNKVMNHLAMQGFWTGSCVLAAILEIELGVAVTDAAVDACDKLAAADAAQRRGDSETTKQERDFEKYQADAMFRIQI